MARARASCFASEASAQVRLSDLYISVLCRRIHSGVFCGIVVMLLGISAQKSYVVFGYTDESALALVFLSEICCFFEKYVI